jgi:hypothetical protein
MTDGSRRKAGGGRVPARLRRQERATARPGLGRISDALLAGKTPTATRKQEEALQAAILAALRKRDGGVVVGEGMPASTRNQS